VTQRSGVGRFKQPLALLQQAACRQKGPARDYLLRRYLENAWAHTGFGNLVIGGMSRDNTAGKVRLAWAKIKLHDLDAICCFEAFVTVRVDLWRLWFTLNDENWPAVMTRLPTEARASTRSQAAGARIWITTRAELRRRVVHVVGVCFGWWLPRLPRPCRVDPRGLRAKKPSSTSPWCRSMSRASGDVGCCRDVQYLARFPRANGVRAASIIRDLSADRGRPTRRSHGNEGHYFAIARLIGVVRGDRRHRQSSWYFRPL